VELPDAVRKILLRYDVELAGEVISDPAVKNGIYVPIRTYRTADGKRSPSHGELISLKNDLTEVGYFADFLLIDREAKSLEDGLRASLMHSFPDLIRNSFVSTTDDVAHIWIDNKRAALQQEENHLKNLIQKYINSVSINEFFIFYMTDELLPSNTEIMFVIRRVSPIGCEKLFEILKNDGYSVPSLDWLNRRFDTLRKAGLLIRRTDNTYVLTAEGLSRLGTRKNRNSPDLSRLLALARQGH